MFIPAEKLDVTQISLTGVRSLALMGLLIVAPRSFKEIKEKFIEMKILEKESSDDVLRIDLNTIKTMGCDVARPCASNGYKYIMLKHPYELEINEDDVKLLKRIYNKVKESVNLDILLNYHDLFKKLADNICDEKIKEQLLGISALKYYNIDELKQFYSDCENRKKIELIYKNTETRKESHKRIKAQKFVFKNNKLYLYGYDLDIENPTILHYKHIKKVISRNLDENKIPTREIVVTYKLKELAYNNLDENEVLLESNEEGLIIKGTYHNDFLAMQRVLSFGAKCIVIEPLDFRKKVIDKLKLMKGVYDGEKSC